MLGLFHFLLPDDGDLIARQLRALESSRQERLLLIGKPSLAGKIRVYAQGRTELAQVEHIEPGFRALAPAVIIANPQDLRVTDLSGFTRRTIDTGIGRVNERKLLQAIWAGQLAEYLKQQRRTAVLAVRAEDIPLSASAGTGHSASR